jgi:tRNA 2-thiouridine synthesizing protein A
MSSAGEPSGEAMLLDLRGEICPFTFVRCKLKLEQMALGQELHVWVDNLNAAKNVPRSLRAWGQQVISVEVVQSDKDWPHPNVRSFNPHVERPVWKIVVVHSK